MYNILGLKLTIFLARTFDYIERELPKVPASIPVLILANHMDMSHHRTVNPEKVKYYLEELDR